MQNDPYSREDMRLQVGDKVTCTQNGLGEVVRIDRRGDYPVEVAFEDIVEAYKRCGREYWRHRTRSLYRGHEVELSACGEEPTPSKTKEEWINIWQKGRKVFVGVKRFNTEREALNYEARSSTLKRVQAIRVEIPT